MKKVLLALCACAVCIGAQAQLISGGHITTTTSYQHVSDSAQIQINTNVPTNLTLDGTNMGETQATPYRVKFGQHKLVLTADGYYRRTKNVEVQRNTYNVFDIKMLRKPRRYAIRHGLQQEIVLNYDWIEYEDDDYNRYHSYDFNSGLVDYVIGWRFNDWVFLGAGTGLHIYNGYAFDEDMHRYFRYNNYEYVGSDRPYWEGFEKTLVEMPLYAQLKVYFMNTRWKPFLMTSLGGRIGLSSYGDSGILFNIGPGVEFCINDRYALNLVLGYSMAGHHIAHRGDYMYFYSTRDCDKYCPYKGEYHYHYNIEGENALAHGLTLRLGFVF